MSDKTKLIISLLVRAIIMLVIIVFIGTRLN